MGGKVKELCERKRNICKAVDLSMNMKATEVNRKEFKRNHDELVAAKLNLNTDINNSNIKEVEISEKMNIMLLRKKELEEKEEEIEKARLDLNDELENFGTLNELQNSVLNLQFEIQRRDGTIIELSNVLGKKNEAIKELQQSVNDKEEEICILIIELDNKVRGISENITILVSKEKILSRKEEDLIQEKLNIIQYQHINEKEVEISKKNEMLNWNE